MKITEIDTLTVDGIWRNWVFVRVATDSEHVGYGEASLESREQAVTGAVKDFARQLLGRNPFDINLLLRQMTKHAHWESGPVVSSAAGGIEMALWDILGKAMEQPVSQLLGGAVHERIPVYANGWWFGATDAEDFARRARTTVDAGFHALKFAPFGSMDFRLDEVGLNRAEGIVAAVRESVGETVSLMIEGHGRFSLQSALRVIERLRPYDIAFFEEPTHPGDLTSTAQLAGMSSVPISGGERCYDVPSALRMIQTGISVFQPDVIHLGGITRMLTVGGVCDAMNLQIAPHNSTGPIGTAATLHVAAVMPALYLQELFEPGDAPWKATVALPAVHVEDGYVAPPVGPGLGLAVDEAEIERHPYVARDLGLLQETSVTGAGGHTDRRPE